jgi:hypothetical protein
VEIVNEKEASFKKNVLRIAITRANGYTLAISLPPSPPIWKVASYKPLSNPW